MTRIVLDTSALLAVLLHEPQALECARCMSEADEVLISSVTRLESEIVMYARKARVGTRALVKLLDLIGAQIIPFDSDMAEIAIQANRLYGKGCRSGSRARLNFGDLCSYALSAQRECPLLFIGDDFTHTDLVSALHR